MARKRSAADQTPLTIDDLASDPRNPRTISETALAGLDVSVTTWGDLSGITFNRSNGQLIGGHQRVRLLRAAGAQVQYDERGPFLVDPRTDERFPIRVVDFDEENHLAANLAANAPNLQGEFSVDALPILESLSEDLPDLYGSLGFDALAETLGAQFKEPDAGGPRTTTPGEHDDDVPPAPKNVVSRTGDIWCIGKHKLIVADAGDRAAIAKLMGGGVADLCFTSPPYGQQREYKSGGINDWDKLMQSVCAALPMAQDGQVLVNLGLIHRDNEYIPYWERWIEWMRSEGWRRFAWYVWDQGAGMPGDWGGRLAPAFEFVFHFNKASKHPNKIVECKNAGKVSHGVGGDGLRGKDGEFGTWQHGGSPTQSHRIPDSTIRIERHHGAIGDDISHPAVFPVALPMHVIEAYSQHGDVLYEPFCGSGTTIIAAERTGRVCRAVELAPEYADVTLARLSQVFENIQITLESTGEAYEVVAAQRDGGDA